MVTQRRKYELQRIADRKALALEEKTSKRIIAKNKKEIKKLKTQAKAFVAAQKAKKAILAKKKRKR